MNDTRVSIRLLLTGVMLRVVVPTATGQVAWPPDEAQLKAYFMEEFIAIDGYDSENTRRLKDGGVSDEQLHLVLSEIYAEADNDFGLAKTDYERMVSTQRRQTAVQEMGGCADAATKAFLLDLAADNSKDGFLRTIAVGSYLRAANAGEARDALVRFLVGEDKMDDMMRMSIYQNAQMAWREAESVEKKAAIIAALYSALCVETPPWVFRVGDRTVCEISPRYSTSRERLVLLERALAYPFPELRKHTKRELTSRLDEMRKLKVLASVSTNLAVLKDRDFNQPLLEDERIALMTPPDARQADNAPQEEPPRMGRAGLYTFGGLALVAAVSLFLIRRCKTRGK